MQSRLRALALQTLALAVGTWAAFFLLHQLLIAWALNPIVGIVFALVLAIPVVFAYNAWQDRRPVHGAWLGLGAALCGAVAWAASFAIWWGRGADPEGMATVLAAATTAAAVVLGAVATWFATRSWRAVAWSALALAAAWGPAAMFVGVRPTQWVHVSATLALALAMVAGGWSLEWHVRRARSRSKGFKGTPS